MRHVLLPPNYCPAPLDSELLCKFQFVEQMLEIQNSKCKVQNCRVSFGNDFIIIGEADAIILHFAFYILHSDN